MKTEAQRLLARERCRRWRENNRAHIRDHANRVNAEKRAIRLAAKALEPPPTVKRCVSCLTEKALSMFGLCRRHTDGLNSYCKTCRAEKNRSLSIEGREKKRAAQHRYYVAHREEVLLKIDAMRKRRKAENPELVLAEHRRQQRQWKAKNPERARAGEKRRRERHRVAQRILLEKWCAAHPERVRELHRRSENNRRARKAGTFVETIDASFVFDRDDGICGICGESVARNEEWHIDHVVPLARGGAHSYANVQLAHAMCNIKKGARLSA